MKRPVGIIAGSGLLPITTAKGIHKAGHRVVCVGLRDQFDSELPDQCDHFKSAGLIQIGRWIRLLKKWGCEEAVLVGRVSKLKIYDPFIVVRHRPDLRAGKIWFFKLSKDKRTNRLLGAVADELASEGITLIDSTTYITEHLADEGVMTKTKPSSANNNDINFALPIVQCMGELDVGQAIAVKDGDVLAVEAIEGTDRMIERAGSLCRKGKWTLIKIAKPNQDMRFDVPTVGPMTIENLQKHNAACLAVEAGKTIILDKPQTLAAADKAGIAVVGVTIESPDSSPE